MKKPAAKKAPRKPAKAKATPEGGEARATPPKHAGGRPTLYTPELAMQICEKVADGWSTRRICKEEWAPDKATFFRWQVAIPEFCDLLARAREMQADGEFEETIEIADDGSLDRTTRKDRAGNEYEVTDMDVVQRSKLMVETRLKRIAIMSPRYRVTTKMELTGKDGQPLNGKIDDSELDARIVELVRKAGIAFPPIGKSPA